MPINIILLGHGSLALASSQALATSSNVTQLWVSRWSQTQQAKRSKGYNTPEEQAFKRYLKKSAANIIPLSSANSPEFHQWLVTHQIHCILMASWGEKISPETLAFCQAHHILFWNVHPSLLPKHRGPNPYTASILAGDSHTGVTVHQVDAGYDTGPIVHQQALAIHPADTGGSLRDRCAQTAFELLQNIFSQPPISWNPQPQDNTQASYHHQSGISQLLLRFQQDTPERIDRCMRAHHPWQPGVVYYGDTPLLVGRVTWQFSNSQQVTEPGTVLKRTAHSLIVQSTDPTQNAVLEQLQFPAVNGFLPTWASPLLLPCFNLFGAHLKLS